MKIDVLAARKVKNLEFIRNNFPNLFPILNTHTPSRKKLNLSTIEDTVQFDMVNIDNGISVYKEESQAYAEQEVSKFISSCHLQNRLITVPTLFSGEFTIPRFFAKKMAYVVDNSPLNRKSFRYYPFDNKIPLLCILGVGLGAHIELLLEKIDIQHLIIVERDIDELFTTLFTLDWESLFSDYINDESKSMQIIIARTKNYEAEFGHIWNHLVKIPPFFPTGTVFYNHRGRNRNEKILKKIRKDMSMYYSLWGTYDDEINQLNNALHNFNSHIPRLRHPDQELDNTPVLIIGSGPSLDERIEWIRNISDKAIIVSCGSARDVLKRNNITPDFQIELESDYVAAEAYERSCEDNKPREGTTLIAAAQVPPKIFDLYKNKRLYFKDSTAMASLFSDNNVVTGCTPSATNAGLGIVLHLNFKNIFLFGMDFGYIDPNKHHSKDSIYYTDDSPEDLIDSTWSDLENGDFIEGVDERKVQTIPFLYTAKRRVEVELGSVLSKRELNSFNCSLGVKIDHSTWLKDEAEFINEIDRIKCDREKSLIKFTDASSTLSDRQVKEKLELLGTTIKVVSKRVFDIINFDDYSQKEMDDICNQISILLEQDIYKKLKTIYYMFRGSLWFFLSIGYSHSYALEGQEKKEFLILWETTFKEFLSEWKDHYESIVYRNVDIDNDPMLTKMITEEVEGV